MGVANRGHAPLRAETSKRRRRARARMLLRRRAHIDAAPFPASPNFPQHTSSYYLLLLHLLHPAGGRARAQGGPLLEVGARACCLIYTYCRAGTNAACARSGCATAAANTTAHMTSLHTQQQQTGAGHDRRREERLEGALLRRLLPRRGARAARAAPRARQRAARVGARPARGGRRGRRLRQRGREPGGERWRQQG